MYFHKIKLSTLLLITVLAPLNSFAQDLICPGSQKSGSSIRTSPCIEGINLDTNKKYWFFECVTRCVYKIPPKTKQCTVHGKSFTLTCPVGEADNVRDSTYFSSKSACEAARASATDCGSNKCNRGLACDPVKSETIGGTE